MAKITTYNPQVNQQTLPYDATKLNVQDCIEIVQSVNDLYDEIPTSLFVGKFSSLQALQTAFPTGVNGNYAIVTATPNDQEYIWDSDHTSWVLTENTPASTFAALGGNPGDNAALAAALAAKQNTLTAGSGITINGNTISANASSTYQTETLAYYNAVVTAGGKISASTLGLVDKLVIRGKDSGWWSHIKDGWLVSGDTAALAVRIVALRAWTINNFDGTEYDEETGCAIPNNTNKYISTGLIPDNEGLGSKNMTIAGVLGQNLNPSNFGRLIGTATGSGDSIYFSSKENEFGTINAQFYNNFGTDMTAFCAILGATTSTSILNGSIRQQIPSTVVAMPDEINLFRSIRGNGMQYANGSLCSYFILDEITPAQGSDLCLALMQYNAGVRRLAKKPRLLVQGNSIPAGTGTNGQLLASMSDILAQNLGLLLENSAQGSAAVFTNDPTSGAISLFNRYQINLNKAYAAVFICDGTNDIGADTSTDGDSGLIAQFYNNLSTIMRDLVQAGNRIVLMSPPYRPDEGATKMLAYVSKSALIGADSTIRQPWVDAYSALLDTGSPNSYLADGLHPNIAGHALLAQRALQALILRQLYRLVSLDFGSIAAFTSADLVINPFYNAETTMSVFVTPPATIEAGIILSGFVNANGQVTVRAFNITAIAINPAVGFFGVTVQLNY